MQLPTCLNIGYRRATMQLGRRLFSTASLCDRKSRIRQPCSLERSRHSRLRQRAAAINDDSDGSPPAFVDESSLVKRWLPSPPELNSMPARSWSPASLAYLGDSIWELYARRYYFAPARLHSTYVSKVSLVCRAEMQHEFVTWLAENVLNEQEKGIVKWGRNADAGKVPTRLRASPRIYRSATALEVLVGFLFVTDPARLEQIMALVGWDGEAAQAAAVATAKAGVAASHS